MATLYESHNQGQDRSVYTCNNCEKHVEKRYHCTVCPDFDVCVNCFNKDGHQHKMEKFGFGLDDDSASGDQKQRNLKESLIQQCIKYLVHACQCRDANCRLCSRQKLKKLIQHTKRCKQKDNGECPVCEQFFFLCCYHAKQCQKANCHVLFCVSIKNKLRQQQLQKRLQQAQILKRRIATMQNREMPSAVLQPSPGNSNSIGNSTMEPPQVMPNPGPSIAGMQSLAQAWQQLLPILKSPASAQQRQQVLAILKANPQIIAAYKKYKTAQQQQQQQ